MTAAGRSIVFHNRLYRVSRHHQPIAISLCSNKHSAMITLIRGDITRITADAIVNAANTSLLGGGGVDGAIHHAGGKAILEACIAIRNRQGGCPPGEAVITTAGNLPATWVIHTVGPVWNGGQKGEDIVLAKAYRNSMSLADTYQVKRIAFPNISTGIYHFPRELAAQIAIDTVRETLAAGSGIREVIFVCYDQENYALYRQLLGEE